MEDRYSYKPSTCSLQDRINSKGKITASWHVCASGVSLQVFSYMEASDRGWKGTLQANTWAHLAEGLKVLGNLAGSTAVNREITSEHKRSDSLTGLTVAKQDLKRAWKSLLGKESSESTKCKFVLHSETRPPGHPTNIYLCLPPGKIWHKVFFIVGLLGEERSYTNRDSCPVGLCWSEAH